MSGDLQQIDDAGEARPPGQHRRDVREVDFAQTRHLYGARTKTIAAAELDVGLAPDAHAAGDLPAHDPLAQAFGEHHRPRRPGPSLEPFPLGVKQAERTRKARTQYLDALPDRQTYYTLAGSAPVCHGGV